MTHSFLRSLALASLVALVPPARAADDKPKTDAYEPAARKLLDEVAAAYKALPGYSDSGKLVMKMEGVAIEGRKPQVVEGEARRAIAYTRPNKLALSYLAERFVCDGKTMRVLLDHVKKYAEAPAPDRIDERAIVNAPFPDDAGIVFFRGQGDLAVAVILDLLCADDGARSVLEGTNGLKLEADRKVGDKGCRSLFVDQSSGPDIRMLVDPESKLVRAVDLEFNPESITELNSHLPEGSKVSKLFVTWNGGEIHDSAPASAFKAEPPADFEKLAARDEAVGKPAPDFTLTVLASEGKTRKVTKADLAGKVVLLDFWATWCGPCLQELPHIQKLVDGYARDRKNVMVVAVSEDSEPTDIPGLRKLIEDTLKEHKANLIEGLVSMVAVDPSQSISELYKVDGIPTTFLIDAKGIVQAVHMGYTKGEVLSREIDALLEGKPIPKAEKGENDKAKSDRPDSDK